MKWNLSLPCSISIVNTSELMLLLSQKFWIENSGRGRVASAQNLQSAIKVSPKFQSAYNFFEPPCVTSLPALAFLFRDLLIFFVIFLLSVSTPFRGDYVGLRRNPAWKDTLKRNRLHKMDQRIVFSDIANKMNRSNGKVGKNKRAFFS